MLELFWSALANLGLADSNSFLRQIVIIPHGGYGRRDVAPFSDVDLMILALNGAAKRVERLAERFFTDIVDANLILGHSVRTPEEACQLARDDPQICTSLIEARFLAGSVTLFSSFIRRFHDLIGKRGPRLLADVEQERRAERHNFGRTVYLVEPNVKRSRGGLRDVQLLRWIGMVRYGTTEPDELCSRGVLSEDDYQAITRANEFLLWLRNEMHFHAGRSSDTLTRSEQVRIAGLLGLPATAGMLPVEQFMRDYFRHADQVSQVVTRFLAKARSPGRLARMVSNLFAHRVQGGFRVDARQIRASKRGLSRLRGNLEAIVELVDLANLYHKRIAAETWEVVRQEAPGLPDTISSEALRYFRSLLSHPARPGKLLRLLHDVGLLERFIPAFTHARGLLQFNQYHKYTVDEHCFRSVDEAVGMLTRPGLLGNAYRGIVRKHVLHLALLIHDLGKGYPEEHCEVGLRIAVGTAKRLGLDARETDQLEFLVHKHLMMNHLAFRRDTSDEQLIVQFAVDVGSPELLGMLYVLTVADLSAVGPGAWNDWRASVISDVYQRAMQYLSADGTAIDPQQQLIQHREAVRSQLGREADKSWFVKQLDALPNGYLNTTSPEQIAADLRLLHGLGRDEVNVQASYQADTKTVCFTIATREDVSTGVFHRLTGALSSQGLEILSAEINTLAEGLVLDRFWTRDPDYAGQPPEERIERINRAVTESLTNSGSYRPSFRRTWRIGGQNQPTTQVAQNRVQADNSTSQTHTILDVFAVDRPGLLYAVARTLFESGLSVSRARIGTYLDQVVDVFYVTDQSGSKIEDESQLAEIRQRLLETIESAQT